MKSRELITKAAAAAKLRKGIQQRVLEKRAQNHRFLANPFANANEAHDKLFPLAKEVRTGLLDKAKKLTTTAKGKTPAASTLKSLLQQGRIVGPKGNAQSIPASTGKALVQKLLAKGHVFK